MQRIIVSINSDFFQDHVAKEAFWMTYETVGVSANYAIRDAWHNRWKSGWSGFLSCGWGRTLKGTSVIRPYCIHARKKNRLSPFFSLGFNPFASPNCCSIIPSQRLFRIRRAVYLIFIESILSFGIRSDSYVIKRNRPLLTYYVLNYVSVLPESRLPRVENSLHSFLRS